MAYREVTMLEIKEVLWRWLAGDSKKAIARQLGVARNTVRHYIEVAEAQGLAVGQGTEALSEERLAAIVVQLQGETRRERGESWTTCSARKSFIEEKLGAGVRLTKVHRLLKRSGVVVPYSTLHRFAASELDFGGGATSVPVADCAPGQEVQVDTGWMTLLEPDVSGRRPHARCHTPISAAVCSSGRSPFKPNPWSISAAIHPCSSYSRGMDATRLHDDAPRSSSRPPSAACAVTLIGRRHRTLGSVPNRALEPGIVF